MASIEDYRTLREFIENEHVQALATASDRFPDVQIERRRMALAIGRELARLTDDLLEEPRVREDLESADRLGTYFEPEVLGTVLILVASNLLLDLCDPAHGEIKRRRRRDIPRLGEPDVDLGFPFFVPTLKPGQQLGRLLDERDYLVLDLPLVGTISGKEARAYLEKGAAAMYALTREGGDLHSAVVRGSNPLRLDVEALRAYREKQLGFDSESEAHAILFA